MRAVRIVVAWVAIAGMSTSAFAGDLQASIAKVVAQQEAPSEPGPIPKPYLWAGTALFVGGMAMAVNGFLNNRNGEFPEFGEADATNIKMGTAGMAAAFGGGLLLFLGKHKTGGSRPAITVDRGRVTASHQIRW